MIQGRESTWGHGSNAAPTTIVDYTAHVRSINFDESMDEVEASVWGSSGYRDYEQGWKDGNLTVVYKYSSTIWNVVKLLKTNGTEIDYEYGIQGDDTGDPSKTGTMICVGCSHDNGTDGLLEITTRWRLTSEPIEGTFA